MFGAIRNAQGELLDYSFSPGAEGCNCLLVIGHGVTANKDRAWAVTLALVLQRAGYASLRFSFSGNGESEGRFEASCPSKGARDLSAVLDAAKGWELVYVGHSMGGAVGVLVAAQDPRIQRMVSLAGMVHTAAFAQRKFGDCTVGEDCMWDKPECPLAQEFLDDMIQIDSVEAAAAALEIPWLLLHGDQDTVVPLEESLVLAAQGCAGRRLITMPGVDHVFSDAAANQMAQHVVAWLG